VLFRRIFSFDRAAVTRSPATLKKLFTARYWQVSLLTFRQEDFFIILSMSLPLFSPPPATPSSSVGRPADLSHGGKLRALESAAATSRTPFKTLVAIAAAESNFDVNARNRKSSAAGPFQMTERTWLQLVQRYGAQVGRADLAALVTADGQGRANIAAEHRAQVLDSRRDMDLAAKLAAKLCDENRVGLARKLGREPSEAEVRMAYFLGLPGAARLIAASDTTPQASVKSLLPQAYANHRPMFSDQGRPLTAERAADALEARYVREIELAPAAAPARTAAAALPQPPTPRPAAHPAVLLAAMEPAETPRQAAPPVAPPPEPPAQVAAAEDPQPKELECRPTEGGVRCTL
jgi:hypothetical protein